MLAIDAGEIEKVKLLINQGANLELSDDFNDTALGHAVQRDFPEAVELLLSHNVDRGHHPKYPLKRMEVPVQASEFPRPAEMKQLFTEKEWRQHMEKTVKLMEDVLEEPKARPVMMDV